MRELTFEEMEQVGGGNILGELVRIVVTWAITKGLDYVVDNADDYYEYLTHCWATYGAGPYDYRFTS